MHGGCAAFLIDAYVSSRLDVLLHYRACLAFRLGLACFFLLTQKTIFLLQMYYARVLRRLAQRWSVGIDGRCVPCPGCLVSEILNSLPFPPATI